MGMLDAIDRIVPLATMMLGVGMYCLVCYLAFRSGKECGEEALEYFATWKLASRWTEDYFQLILVRTFLGHFYFSATYSGATNPYSTRSLIVGFLFMLPYMLFVFRKHYTMRTQINEALAEAQTSEHGEA